MCKSNGRGRRRCSRLYPRESCQRNKKMIEVNSPSSLRPQQTMRIHGNILPPEMTHPTPQRKFNTMASRQVTAGLRAPHTWLSVTSPMSFASRRPLFVAFRFHVHSTSSSSRNASKELIHAASTILRLAATSLLPQNLHAPFAI
jgi:hypothetical protein